ncbi:MAG: hypothetical protein J0I86_18145, partial [Mesorhizobium sp.]|nr:hypothetical protein [Mesorhizobium sp.]
EVFPSLAEELIRLQRVKQPAFADLNVRMAMNYAIDKQAIADVVYFGTAKVQDSEMPRTRYYVAQAPYTYDVDKAKDALKRAVSVFGPGSEQAKEFIDFASSNGLEVAE